MRLVLVGPPGSGKGTQAKRLVEQLGLSYIGTGEILRDAIRRQSELGQAIEPLIKQGLLVPDTVVNDVVAELFRGTSRPKQFVMDGYPRTLAQAIAFDDLLNELNMKLDTVISLHISDDEVVNRISRRRVCSNPKCAATYHLDAAPTVMPGICDRCGSPLLVRLDDQEETVRRRLREFYRNTDALLDHYRALGLVEEFSSLEPSKVVFANIVKHLQQFAD